MLFEGRGSIPGWAATSFTLVSEWKKPIRYRMKKVRLFSNWHGDVKVKAVVYEARGGGLRFTAGPRALLSWFQSGRKGYEEVVTVLRNLTSSC